MAKLLILNGSHSDIPLIEAGKQLGFHVITSGNAPELPGHRHAHEYHWADYSNKEQMLEVAKKLGIDAVCSCANDFGVITAAYIAEQLGLPGHDSYETTLTLHHKDKFKAFVARHGLSGIPSLSFDNRWQALQVGKELLYPQIVKPIDLSGGKGVTKVTCHDEYPSAVELAFSLSRAKRIVVETLISGTQHSLHCFLHRGKVIFHFSDNEYSFINPFLVSTSAAPATRFEHVKNRVIQLAEEVAQRLFLQDGVLHVQYLLENDDVHIIEYTRRCPGDFYTWPVEYATGVDTASWMVKVATGMDCANFPQTEQQGYCGRHCLMAGRDGVVAQVRINEELTSNVYSQYKMWEKGQVVDHYLSQKMGVLFLRYDSMAEMLDKTKRINELAQVELEP